MEELGWSNKSNTILIYLPELKEILALDEDRQTIFAKNIIMLWKAVTVDKMCFAGI